MRLIVQRSLASNVTVDNKIVGSIDKGLVVLVGFKQDDTENDIDALIKKLINLRIFEDNNGKMNLSLLDIGGSILSISQFTLYASTKKGNRPSFIDAMEYKKAEQFYNKWNEKLKEQNIKIETGVFGADMKVSICNDGPVTIILESREENDKK